ILVSQWVEECRSFNFKNVFTSYDRDWSDKLKKNLLNIRVGNKSNFIFISTYATYNRSRFQDVLGEYKCEQMILIADEAHNLGTKRSISNYLTSINKRIGLSATPGRNFDEHGTKEIEKYFDSFYPNHTYTYPMLKAIKDGYLTPYYYYPKFVRLTESE